MIMVCRQKTPTLNHISRYLIFFIYGEGLFESYDAYFLFGFVPPSFGFSDFYFFFLLDD